MMIEVVFGVLGTIAGLWLLFLAKYSSWVAFPRQLYWIMGGYGIAVGPVLVYMGMMK